ncbi:glucose-6-phosphate isomerase [Candidatus Gracilibacteria bacterium]|nr:glucose-6-phosphate isomerase [Candidatus Gracilibacteria bacterium]
MSSLLSLNTGYVDVFLGGNKISPKISLPKAHKSIQDKTCAGCEYLGWVDLPENTNDEIISEIQIYSESLQLSTDILIVCGIGGSYLGARALIEALSNGTKSEVVFLGNHLSGLEYEKVFTKYQDKRVSACIISKSGTTMETAISYRLVRNFLLSKYSAEEVKNRIVTITDEKNGALRAESDKQGYKSYILPSDIGGRYSVLTPVGLIPCAVAGIEIKKLVEGAKMARQDILDNHEHAAFIYAEKRVMLEQSGFVSELFITSEPSLYFIGEWWKQLMGESHGKEGTGLYPDTLSYTTDLHSLGQYVQEGRRLFFETMLWIKNSTTTTTIPSMSDLSDGLDPLVGRSLHDINLIALESTAKAHNDGRCPSMMMTIEELNEHNLGYFLYTMMYACALSGIMIGVNPFDQPGVEAYKSEMRKRLK